MKRLKYLMRVQRLSMQQRVLLAAGLNRTAAAETAGRRLVAFVVRRSGHAISEEELREFLRSKLPDFMHPSGISFLDALPSLPNGKVDRRALASRTSEPKVAKDGCVAPRTETEQKLARIWASVLGTEKVGVYDNFFQLGGHSLLALQVMARLRETFQAEVPLRRLFETPTVAGLAQAVEASKRGGQGPSIRRVSQPLAGPPELDSVLDRSDSNLAVAASEEADDSATE